MTLRPRQTAGDRSYHLRRGPWETGRAGLWAVIPLSLVPRLSWGPQEDRLAPLAVQRDSSPDSGHRRSGGLRLGVGQRDHGSLGWRGGSRSRTDTRPTGVGWSGTPVLPLDDGNPWVRGSDSGQGTSGGWDTGPSGPQTSGEWTTRVDERQSLLRVG